MAETRRSNATHSQTLSRGIRILEILADSRKPMTIAALASALGVHRSIAYRILRTLEDHQLVVRDATGGVHLSARIAELAHSVAPDLQAAALPELTRVCGELTMTAFLSVLEGPDCVVLLSVEPRHQAATILYQPGARHPATLGAPGIAIASRIPQQRWDALFPGQPMRPEIADVHTTGYAVTKGEVIRGMSAIAVPINLPDGGAAAIAIVYVESEWEVDHIGTVLKDTARRIERAVSRAA